MAPKKTAPRETELPSEEQRVAEDGSRNHREEGGTVEKRSLGAKRGWRALQDSHRRTRVFIPHRRFKSHHFTQP